MDWRTDMDSVISIVHDDSKLHVFPSDTGVPEARWLVPYFLDIYLSGMWESQRNDSSGQGCRKDRARHRRRAGTDTSGPVLSAYQAINCGTVRTDTSIRIFSMYRVIDHG